jgi:PAS domain S-box-containing protein
MSLFTPKKLIFFCALLFVHLGVDLHAAKTRLLFLSSYHSEFPTAAHHLEAVTDLLKVEGRQLEVVYMDSKRDTIAVSFPRVYEHIKANIQESGPYDLILSSDDNALEFLLHYKEELAGETPVIFFGINSSELAQRAIQRQEYSGVIERASLHENVELAFNLFPKLGTLHVIADASVSGQADLKALQLNLSSEFVDRVVIEDLAQNTFAEVAEHLQSYPSGDVILFLSAYIDGVGTHFGFLESVLWLRQHTQIPVLHPYEHGIGQGFLGGKVISHYRMAQRAVQMAEEFLSGQPSSGNRLVDEDFIMNYFDYKEVLRYGISPGQLPAESIILGKPLSFFTKYKAYCIAAFVIAVLMAIFGQVAGLMYLRERRLLSELRESEGQTASLFENSYTPILLIKPDDGRILDANPAALAYYGYSKQVMTRLNLAEIDEGTFARIDDALDRISNGECKSFQSKHRLKNGEQRQVEILFTCIQRQQHPVLFSIVQDTTELRESEAALIEAKEAAEAASHAKNVFLATMSHELRTPLNPIIGFTELLLEANNLTNEQRQWLQVTKSRSTDLLRLIEDVLDVARIEAGRLAVEVKPTLVQEIVDDISNFFNKPSSEKGLTLYCRVAPELSSPCMLDPTKTRQILLNLVGNAVKFSSEGEIQIIAELDRAHLHDNAEQALHLIIRDCGPGIPLDQHDFVFQEFQQLDSSYTRKHDGSGLGLAICKRFVELMGGRIWIDEHYTQGAEFHVCFPAPMLQLSKETIPLDKAMSGEPSKSNSLNDATAVQDVPKHVLLVEDDESNAKVVMVCLNRKQLQVTHATNGQLAIDLCAKQRFDLILMDLKMPIMSGCEAIRILRDRGDETPIVVLTAFAAENVHQNLQDAHLSGVLHKPVSIEELDTMLDRMLKEQA